MRFYFVVLLGFNCSFNYMGLSFLQIFSEPFLNLLESMIVECKSPDSTHN